MIAGRTFWIIGASEGLGRALAHELDQAGARLVLSARSAGRLDSLAEEIGGTVRVVPMDVTDPASVRDAVAAAGEVDGMIYCAGFYEPLGVAEWKPEAVEAMCDVNFMGAVRVLGQVAPAMAARGRGHLVLIGSLAGFTGLPGAIGYGASKAAVMHLAENMQADLRGTGVRVQQINPGFIRTRLTDKNEFAMPMIMEPDEAARRVVHAMKSGRFATSFPRVFSWLFRAGRFLPRSLFLRLF
ncbi:MAG: putative short-chain dehydrogenase [Rhodobacteraceae bacterium HLUCCO07]|nr:MAG: putative short-chain dehydrogenase [Rhodobacteraceae bacterium HLUCCO07]